MSLKSRISAGHILCLSFFGLSLGAAGCFLRPNTVIERFNGEFRCPKEQIKVERPDKNQPDFFRASGCNRRANFRCTGDYGEFCERVGQPETIQPEGMIDSSVPPGGANTAPAQQN